jgi:hypothetical protein
MIEMMSEKFLPKFFSDVDRYRTWKSSADDREFPQWRNHAQAASEIISRVRPTSSAVVENLRTSVLPLCLHQVANRIPSAPAAAATSR